MNFISQLLLLLLVHTFLQLLVAYAPRSISSRKLNYKSSKLQYRQLRRTLSPVSHFSFSFSQRKINLSSTPITEQEWKTTTVVSNKKEGEGLRIVDIEVDDDMKNLYTVPGQFVKLKVGDAKPSFFAIASPPDGRNAFSFLIKDSPNNDFILNAKEGDKLDMSSPMGKGYEIEEYFDKYKADFPTNSVLLFACGTGLAPIAAAIESGKLGLKGSTFRTIFTRKGLLYIGARTPAHLPFKDRYQAWEEMGLKVIPVISRPNDALSADWTGRTGYIQDALKEDKVPVPRNCGALLCGMRDMTDNVKELLLEAGTFEGRILFNF